MVTNLDETRPERAAIVGALDDGLHEAAAEAVVLVGGVDEQRADAEDGVALVEAVAADDAVGSLGDQAVEISVGEHLGGEAGGEIDVGNVEREAVELTDLAEGLEAEGAADFDIAGAGAADCDLVHGEMVMHGVLGLEAEDKGKVKIPTLTRQKAAREGGAPGD